MKQFFKMMFASAFGVLLAAGILVAIAFSMLVGIAATWSGTPSYTPEERTVLKIRLDGTLVDSAEENPLAAFIGEEESTLSLRDLLAAIRVAREDSRVVGIYLESGVLSSGSASLGAIRDALTDFKASGKFVVAYGDLFTQGNYYLCSVADKIFLNPQGLLELSGIAAQTMFYKDLLAHLGIEMQIFRVGTYKSAVEPFMLDRMSDASREQIQSYVTVIWKNITEGIAASRSISEETVQAYANQGHSFSDPTVAIEKGLIDALKYRSEAEDYVRELAGQSGHALRTATVAQINTSRSSSLNPGDACIAVLYAEGEIMDTEANDFYDMEKCISTHVIEELARLREDDGVKAVVFRINSPGGSAYLSEQIWHQMVELRKKKPVVVSMGDVAASGGYYIACAANRIIAEPNTLTGSIGIFGVFPNAAGLFDKIGLSTEVVKTNAFSDLGNLSRPMTESEKTLIQGYVERGYRTFLTRCADGRNMSLEAVDKIAQGRVWTGEQALEIGLVDALGGIDTAIRTAAELAEIDSYEVMPVSGSKNFWEELWTSPLGEVRSTIAREVLGEEFMYYRALRQAKANMGLYARLPFNVRPL